MYATPAVPVTTRYVRACVCVCIYRHAHPSVVFRVKLRERQPTGSLPGAHHAAHISRLQTSHTEHLGQHWGSATVMRCLREVSDAMVQCPQVYDNEYDLFLASDLNDRSEGGNLCQW